MSTAVPFPQCPYCGCVPHQHLGQCPAIQKIEYYPDGTIKSVEKKTSHPSDRYRSGGLFSVDP